MKATYDDNLLRAFLLGSLADEETERCDELSFTDDEFAERLQVVEDDLVDAYLQNELTKNELGQFEAYYLASPRRQEKVKFARSLQSFAAQQVAAPAISPVEAPVPSLPRTATEPEVSWWESLRNLFTLPNLTMQWGMATAALLLLLAGGWMLTEMRRLRGQMDAAQTERVALQNREQELQQQLEQQRGSNAQSVERLNEELKRTQQQLEQLKQQQLAIQQAKTQTPVEAPSFLAIELSPQTRGVGRTAELTMSGQTDYALLQLLVPEEEYQSYRAEVLTQVDEKLKWKSGKLKARTRGNGRVIDVSLRASLLAPGNYAVKLFGVTPDGQAEELRKYSFKVVKS